MRNRKEARNVARRDLLKLAGLGGVAGAAAIAASGGTAKAAVKTDGRKGSGYRETEHVRKYYDLAKF